MVEARVPDDMRDWNAMDIFIFSNGQQYSPPRKYHLCSDDLKYWESTRRFLARSQYGSLHSEVDLYTTEGRKVDGPLELSNDEAYVAVIPPDLFIQSGYDKYLLRASRSWEKRHENIINTTKNTPQEKALHSGNFETTAEINNKAPRDNPLLPAGKGRGNIKPKPTSKTKPLTNLKPSTRSSGIAKDPLEKPKLLSAKTFLRKVTNSGKSLNTSSQRENTNLNNIVPVNKSTVKDLPTTPQVPPILGIIFETESESPNKVTPEQNHSPANMTEIKENLVTDNIRSSFNTNHNADINIPTDSHNVAQKSEGETSPVFKDEVKNKPVKDTELNNNLLSVIVNEYHKNHNDNLTKDIYDNPIITKEIGTQYSNVLINEIPEQNPTKECILNLNLSIDMKGYNSFPNNNNESLRKYCNLQSEESFTNLKIDIDKERLQTQDQFINSVNSTKCVNDNVTSQSCGNTKIVVVKCSCSSNNFNNDKTFKLQCKEIITPNYFILVPTRELINSDSKFKLSMTNTDAKSYDVKMCPSNLNNINELLDNPELFRISSKNSSKNVNVKDQEDVLNNSSINSKKDIAKEHKVSVSTENPQVRKCSLDQAISTKSNLPTETNVNENNNVLRNCPQCAWTQTEWCHVLVEARYNQIGGYTFHLPSLEKLKQYNL